MEMEAREYQSEIEERCARENCIVYLPTGAGKTFVAIRTLKRFRRAIVERGERAFFLVNSVPLAYQHARLVETLTDLRVRAVTGSDRPDLWDDAVWAPLFEETHVFVATAQILLDALLHGYARLSRLCLLVFDECHAAVDAHPMRQIMSRYTDASAAGEKRPRVVGLTATLVNRNVRPEGVADALRRLEVTFDAKICTVDRLDRVAGFSTNPRETLVTFDDPEPEPVVGRVVRELDSALALVKTLDLDEDSPDAAPAPAPAGGFVRLDKTVSVARKLGRIKDALARNALEHGTFGAAVALLCALLKLERLKMRADSRFHPTLQFFIGSVTYSRLLLESHMKAATRPDDLEARLFRFSSPKILLLLRILKEYSNESVVKDKIANVRNEKIRGIVFVKERTTALSLYFVLKFAKMARPDEFDFLRHDFVTGFNANPYKDTREDHYVKKQNMKAIEKFSSGLVNCLISTEILEEGFDLPECNLVVRFDKLTNVRSYVQSKGRGRRAESSYVIMMPKSEEADFVRTYDVYRRVHSTLNDTLYGKTDDRSKPSEEEISEAFETDEFYGNESAKITLTSAVSLLSRYCSRLPHDIFTDPQPTWRMKKDGEGTIVTVELPVNSPVKTTFWSAPSANVKLAKQRAALAACKGLHEAKELNDNFLPANKAEQVLSEANVKHFFDHWRILNVDLESASDTKTSKRYVKKMPHCFARGSDETRFFLYLFKIAPNEAAESPEIRQLHDMMTSERDYGMITPRRIHRLCPFVLFNSSGEYTVRVQDCGPVSIPAERLRLVKEFERSVLFDVLHFRQTFAVYDEESAATNHYFVVPVTNGSVDWARLEECAPIEQVAEPSLDERQRLRVTTHEYLHRVVTPWYRSDYNCSYAVLEVCHHLTPQSPFPNESYKSFADYFADKYHCRVECPSTQPMLKVKAIGGNKMNGLVPRTIYGGSNWSKRKIKTVCGLSEDTSDEYILLVPEFCTLFSFPGDLWYKATLLPSILHRVTMLLQAEDLRREIVLGAKIGRSDFPDDYELETLGVDFHSVKQTQQSALSEEEPNVHLEVDVPEKSPSVPCSPMKNFLHLGYEMAKKSMDKEYPWNPESEPLDIYRSIDPDVVTLLNVECYEAFLNEKLDDPAKASPSKGPKAAEPVSVAPNRAICAPPIEYDATIAIIEKTPSEFGPEMKHLVAALTLSRTNDVFNLERHEILGDSFLKFAASLLLWLEFPQYDEGKLTALKGKIVSNRNLQLCGELVELPGRMKVKQFHSQNYWMPPGFGMPRFISRLVSEKPVPSALSCIYLPADEVVDGRLSNNTMNYVDETFRMSTGALDPECTETYFGRQSVRGKEVADCVEALIGTYLRDGGLESGFKMLNWLRILPTEEGWLEDKRGKMKRSEAPPVDQVDFLLNHCRRDVEAMLGYSFENPALLLEALSHSSNSSNRLTDCYQRLEFLGDAVLDFLVTCHIYERNESLSPGDITDLRSALVNNVTFACLVARLGLHKYLLSSNAALESAVSRFVEFQCARDHRIDETVLFLLEEEVCSIANYVDVPKALGDVFESMAGAIYLDSGGDLRTVWDAFYRIMHEVIGRFSRDVPKQPVRLLYERIHAAPQFMASTVTENGRVMVPLKFNANGTIRYVHGFGARRADAKRSAAKIALKILDEQM